MKLRANENLPRDAVLELRSLGHDVVWIKESQPGARDSDVLAWAIRDERVLLTFDKDLAS